MGLYKLWIVTSFVFCLSVSAAHGEIYKWVDENGKVHFSDEKPEKVETEQIDIQINSFEGMDVSDSDFLEARELEARERQKTEVRKRPKVVMYSATWCGYCRKARNYFNQQGIPFREYDIENSSKGRRDYARLNGTGVPIIFVGKKRIQGFRAGRFQTIYNAALNP
jgi:glutaredoxin